MTDESIWRIIVENILKLIKIQTRKYNRIYIYIFVTVTCKLCNYVNYVHIMRDSCFNNSYRNIRICTAFDQISRKTH